MWVSSNRGARRRQSHGLSRCHGKPVTQVSLIGAAALAAGLSLSAPALAASIQSLAQVGPLPEFEVASDGEFYTALDLSAPAFVLKWHVHLKSGAPVLSRVKMYGVSPRVVIFNPVIPDGVPVDLTAYGVSKFFDRPRPKEFKSTVTSDPIPYSLFQPYAVAACNMLAAELREGGMSDSEIFGQDREVGIAVTEDFAYDFTLPEGQLVGADGLLEPNTKIICKKSPSRAPVQEIVTSALALTETSSLSTCRLNTAGSITSLRANQTVSFRYVDENGDKSDIKTVTTSAAKIANFTHQLPLAGDAGAMIGKIRMVGENLSFQSPWADYAVNCNVTAAAGDKVTELPPTVKILEAETIKEVIFGGRWACPSRVWVRGQVSGRGQGVAAVSLFDKESTSGSLFGPKEFEVKQGSEENFAAGHDISWQQFSASSGSPMSKAVSYLARVRMQAGTSESFVADEDELELTLKCRPVWPEVAIKVEVVESAAIGGGFACPVRYQVSGQLVARSDAPVNVEVYADDVGFGPIPHTLSEGAEVNIGPLEGALEWKGGVGNAVPQQSTEFSIRVSGNPGFHLVTEKKTEIFRCTPLSEFAGDSRAQLPTNLQVGPPASAVQVTSGKVRLIGAKPGAIYALRFYRAKLITGPYLPTKMVNGVASLNTSKMKPGQWRVEVCATRNGRGLQILPNTCRDRRFEVRHAATGGPGKHMQEPKPDNSAIFPGGNPWQ